MIKEDLLIKFEMNIKKIFFLLVITLSPILIAQEPVYISLGSVCEPAFRLKDCHLRNFSYPFDWIVSHFDSLYWALEDDFDHFFTDLKLFPDESGTTDYYGLEFHHDWHTTLPYTESLKTIDWQAMAPAIWEKYKRRTDRFKSVCTSENNVVFIRYGDVDKNKAIKLRNLIKEKYPNLRFILMVVKFDEEFKDPWGLENIKNFSMRHFDIPSWDDAFKQVASAFN